MRFLLKLSMLAYCGYSFADVEMITLTPTQCSTMKIALKDANDSIDDIKNKTSSNIKSAVKYSLVQNSNGNSLNTAKIDATWINTDMSYDQLKDSAKTCRMPTFKKNDNLKQQQKFLTLEQCHSIEYFYDGVLDVSNRMNAPSYLNAPMENRNEIFNSVMNNAVIVMLYGINQTKSKYKSINNPINGNKINLEYLTQFGNVRDPDYHKVDASNVITFKKLQTIYYKCLEKYQH